MTKAATYVQPAAPALLPTQNPNLRRALEQWFRTLEIRPRIVGEFEDAVMRTVVAAEGLGFMPMSAAVRKEALTRYGLLVIGTMDQCTDQFYAITAEQRLTHPAVLLITDSVQLRLFSKG